MGDPDGLGRASFSGTLPSMGPHLSRDFGGVRVDTADWPIIVMEFPEHRFQDADFEGALGCIEQIMQECRSTGHKCAQITDLTRMQQIAPASQRKFAGDWAKRNNDLIVAVSVGGATVTPSAILRGLVTAVHWFHRPPTPNAFLATRPEGLFYVIELLERAHVALPPRVYELRDRLAGHSKTQVAGPRTGWLDAVKRR
jgi:hypothetical protein